MSLNFTITVICILFIQIQAKIARDVVEEKQKLSKEEREARKKNFIVSRIYQIWVSYTYIEI